MVPPGSPYAVGRRPLALRLLPMRRAYSLLAYCAVVPLLVYLWWRGRKDPGYRQRWGERFGWHQVPAHHQGGVMLHCASVGEVIAARPLIEQLLADPRWSPLVLTCTTPTGSRMIAREYGARVGQVYFPLDLPGATRRFLSGLRPRLVLLLERELWPNFLHRAERLGVPVALVNARLSVQSAATYKRWHRLMGPALAALELVCAEDAATAGRFKTLGVPGERVQITGNIKSDVRLDPGVQNTIDQFLQALAQRPVLTAGSTHPGEDEALIAAFLEHLKGSANTLLILVPRHPERFDVVAGLLAESGLSVARHSLGQMPTADTQVLLGDSLGELMLWYGVADACFVGGSLVTRGGHNPLEVLCQYKPLMAGPHTTNFEFLYAALRNSEGMLAVADADAVFAQFRALLQDREAARALAARGHTFYLRMAGATSRTITLLQALATPLFRASSPAPSLERRGRDLVWFDPQCFETGGAHLFDLAWWRQQGPTSGAGAGRGRIHWVTDGQRGYLLRHYYRGGWMAKISRDLFLAQPITRTRAMREFSLLTQLRARGLPVPRPCAARHTGVRAGWYRADILVEKIPDASDLAEIARKRRAITPGEWRVLGGAVRRLHDEQVNHADLNCHNLMLDTRGKAWIVDFDKCEFRPGEGWKQHNLDRLLRSLRKELRLDPGFRWSEKDWRYFIAGYQADPVPEGVKV